MGDGLYRRVRGDHWFFMAMPDPVASRSCLPAAAAPVSPRGGLPAGPHLCPLFAAGGFTVLSPGVRDLRLNRPVSLGACATPKSPRIGIAKEANDSSCLKPTQLWRIPCIGWGLANSASARESPPSSVYADVTDCQNAHPLRVPSAAGRSPEPSATRITRRSPGMTAASSSPECGVGALQGQAVSSSGYAARPRQRRL